MNIKKSLSVVLVCSCYILLMSCDSQKEEELKTTTATVEQADVAEKMNQTFEYDPEDDEVPDIPMQTDCDTRVIMNDFLDNPRCEGKMYERLCEIYRAVNELDISKTEHYSKQKKLLYFRRGLPVMHAQKSGAALCCAAVSALFQDRIRPSASQRP